ncbi:hypothetical protein P1X15_22730 [Runella sp. MFBS21]|uniref:hypothetical protein n=1 Tax=Runella sp. MFBS21 TaxID=3034018 RepID=UPI0023F7D4DD|nr:hypothetical protein [Runella sp. MFBS21]MDF7820456.1 hypothetical protein [Runella sp. MFBS21]
MKRSVWLILTIVLLQVDAPEAEAKVNTNQKATVEAASEKSLLRKRKRNRQRKGFMWGLFRKRNACDCPKH